MGFGKKKNVVCVRGVKRPETFAREIMIKRHIKRDMRPFYVIPYLRIIISESPPPREGTGETLEEEKADRAVAAGATVAPG
jgi:hypothetical protein